MRELRQWLHRLGGIGAGLTAALVGAGAISSLLYRVSPRDPQVLVVTSNALFAVALVACWMPARRAALLHPVVALRME